MIYISGPISGLAADVVRRNFDTGARFGLALGLGKVIDPSLLHVPGWGQREYMAHWLNLLATSAVVALVMLPGWTGSTGAKEEHALAIRLGLKIYYLP